MHEISILYITGTWGAENTPWMVLITLFGHKNELSVCNFGV